MDNQRSKTNQKKRDSAYNRHTRRRNRYARHYKIAVFPKLRISLRNIRITITSWTIRQNIPAHKINSHRQSDIIERGDMIPRNTLHKTNHQRQNDKTQNRQDNTKHVNHRYRTLKILSIMQHLLISLIKHHIKRLIK